MHAAPSLDRHARRSDPGVTGDTAPEGVPAGGAVAFPDSGECQGLTLGPYRLVHELGRGGFGRVYKATHALMDRVVALKVIAPERVADERARTMFLREVRAATRLHHANIALAYDAGEVDGQLFLAMEYVDGPTLDQLVRARGPLPLALAGPLLRQAAQALRYAHEQGMVHRDVKPANLLVPHAALAAGDHFRLDGPPLVKVVDFGLARLQKQGTAGTLFAGTDRVFAGTPDFIAPEQARDAHDVDGRSDLYSLGCTLYFALAGRKPFTGSTPLEIVFKHFEQAPEPLGRLRPDLPPELVAVIERLMEKEPARRFASARALLAELGYPCGGSVPTIALPPLSPSVPEPAPTSVSAPQIRLTPAASAVPGGGADADGAWPGEEGLAATLQFPAIDAAAALPGPAATGGPPPELAPSDATLPAPAPPPEGRVGPAPAAAVAEAPGAGTWADRPPRELCLAWSAWYAVLAAQRRGAALGVNPAQYRARHVRLVRQLRAVVEAGGPAREACGRLVALVEPWVDLHTLVSTEPETLDELIRRTAALAAELKLRAVRELIPAWVVIWLLALVAVPLAAIAFLGPHAGPIHWHWPSPHAAWQLVQGNPILMLALLLPATVFPGLYGLSRLLRS